MKSIQYFLRDRESGLEVHITEMPAVFCYPFQGSIPLRRDTAEEMAQVLAVAERIPYLAATEKFPSRGGLVGQFEICREEIVRQVEVVAPAVPCIGKSERSLHLDSSRFVSVLQLFEPLMQKDSTLHLVTFQKDAQPEDVLNLKTMLLILPQEGCNEVIVDKLVSVPDALSHMVYGPNTYLALVRPMTSASIEAPFEPSQIPVRISHGTGALAGF